MSPASDRREQRRLLGGQWRHMMYTVCPRVAQLGLDAAANSVKIGLHLLPARHAARPRAGLSL